MPTPNTIDTPTLLMEWSEAHWDSAIFDKPVLQISHIEIRGRSPDGDFTKFEAARDSLAAGMVSCRLPHDRLRESMLLEDRGFRFIEMVYQPVLEELQKSPLPDDTLYVTQASPEDLSEVLEIARHAFHCERFHVDPRIAPYLGDLRYGNWIKNSVDHPSQRLFLINEGRKLVAFFVTEMLEDGTCYWHLNAVSPNVQRQGYGKRAWIAMLHQAKKGGALRVRTCIVARNHRVLNLYARLNFQFPPPLMTFHWVRPC